MKSEQLVMVKCITEKQWLQRSIVRAEIECLKYEMVSCCWREDATQLFSSLESPIEILFGRAHKRAYTNIAVSCLTCIQLVYKAMRMICTDREKNPNKM